MILWYNVSVAERVVNPPKQAVSVFADTQSSEINDRIFDEFNSLSVLYQKPSYMFTDKEHKGPLEFADELGNLSIREAADNIASSQRVEENDKDLLLTIAENFGAENVFIYPHLLQNSTCTYLVQELSLSPQAVAALTIPRALL
ncbi:beta-adaptin-like protein A [Hibiscus syriacus]|uniref:beta-adaptin-like protein A n=1 Tax=Hibiscus syriacus TaxID=106335 RepID=UPI001923F396|nr:beta-adaptin-like protein A [Hibiscus syriacus]